jgi:hypothetical protein
LRSGPQPATTEQFRNPLLIKAIHYWSSTSVVHSPSFASTFGNQSSFWPFAWSTIG